MHTPPTHIHMQTTKARFFMNQYVPLQLVMNIYILYLLKNSSYNSLGFALDVWKKKKSQDV